MKRVCADDLFETHRMSAYSSSDEQVLEDCYLPLIGGMAFAVFESLRSAKPEELGVHERLLSRLKVSTGEFYNAVEALEAVGLIRTFVKQDDKLACFIYCVYSPLAPAEFFNDPLLAGTLRKYVGEKEYSLLKRKYKAGALPEGFEEATASFLSVFMPDFEDPIYLNSRFGAVGHGSAKVRIDFDYRAFSNRLQELGPAPDILSDQEVAKIERIAALYRLDAETVADCVYESLVFNRKKGQRVDFEMLSGKCANCARFAYTHQESATKSAVSGDTNLANKIRLMDNRSPIDFLGYLQNGHKPSGADQRLVKHLAIDIGLPDPAINALLDFVLEKNDNMLNPSFTEKLAAALVRAGVNNARDAMEYLNGAFKRKGAKAVTPKQIEQPIQQVAPVTQPAQEEEISDEEVDKLIDSLYN